MKEKSKSQQWAEFRLSVIGKLLASPPRRGELKGALKELAAVRWDHPLTGMPVSFHWQTIEEWYYKAKNEKLHTLDVLRPQARSDKGKSKVLTEKVKQIIRERYSQYKFWSYQLHKDNLEVDLKNRGISPIPSYSTVRRYLQSVGKFKVKASKNHNRPGYQKAKSVSDSKEIRSYENEYVNGLWHLDFHHSSREVITSSGEIVRPICLAVIDDHSRLLCHIQWYLTESAEDLIHGFSQALQKRGIPRGLMTDNGGAMTSAEFTEGLVRLGIDHETTLPYSPHQNGKQEILWGQLEGRLMAMLKNKKIVTLKELNDLSTAWAEIEYNKSYHSEIYTTPLKRFLEHSDVSRESPNMDYLKQMFRREEKRKIRKSDATISIDSKRFEVPYQYKHFGSIRIRYTKWDLSLIHMVSDEGKTIARIYPVDKSKNATGIRKTVKTPEEDNGPIETNEYPPLLQEIVSQYEGMGLPPAYLPKDC